MNTESLSNSSASSNPAMSSNRTTEQIARLVTHSEMSSSSEDERLKRVLPKKSETGFHGLFARTQINSGETIIPLQGRTSNFRTRTSIQINSEKHIEDQLGVMVNHSCAPSAKIANESLVAVSNLQQGDEVTFNYSKSEDTISNPFVCLDCGHEIHGSQEKNIPRFDLSALNRKEIILDDLNKKGFSLFPKFVQPETVNALAREQERISFLSRPVDFMMPPYNTPRKSRVIGGNKLAKNSPLISKLYEDVRLLLEAKIGTSFFACNNSNEFAVLNHLNGKDASHGWHMDDPAYVFVMCLKAPPDDRAGGVLEVATNKVAFTPEEIEHAVTKSKQEGGFNKLFINPGDAYIIKEAQNLHQVTALKGGDRVILAFSYNDRINPTFTESADLLYG